MLTPIKILIGKNRMCRKTELSGACDISFFDGNTILVGWDDNEYTYFFGFEIISFSTEDKIIDSTSFMSNNMIPTAVAVDEKHTNFISDRYKLIGNNKIEEKL